MTFNGDDGTEFVIVTSEIPASAADEETPSENHDATLSALNW